MNSHYQNAILVSAGHGVVYLKAHLQATLSFSRVSLFGLGHVYSEFFHIIYYWG